MSEHDEQHPNPIADYQAEPAVNLRGQRLRRPEPTPTDDAGGPDAGEESPTSSSEPVAADPYGVGQDALAAVEQPAAGVLTASYAERGSFSTAEYDPTTEPATRGARGRLNAALGLHLRPKPLSAEVRFRDSVRVVQQPLPGCPVITVANPKGGAGKTPTALLLGNTFAEHRGHGVVVWDTSESGGSLGARAARSSELELSVWDLLEHASELASSSAVSGALSAFLRRQPTKDDVLAGDPYAVRSLGWDECAATMAVLRRHRDMMILDTGTNPLAANWQWAVSHSDVLVVPVPLRVDMATSAFRMLDTLLSGDNAHLIERSVVLVTGTPDSDPSLAARVLDQLGSLGVPEANFLEIGYDPVLAGGDRIVYGELARTTQEGYTNVAALVADNLAAVGTQRARQYVDAYAPQSMYRTTGERYESPHSYLDGPPPRTPDNGYEPRNPGIGYEPRLPDSGYEPRYAPAPYEVTGYQHLSQAPAPPQEQRPARRRPDFGAPADPPPTSSSPEWGRSRDRRGA